MMVIEDVPEPGEPGPLDVIVAPEVVGICGSDLHLYSGDVRALSGGRSFFPRVQGHEFSAVIEQVGSGCPDGLRAGERVAVWPLRSCGHCFPCRSGRGNACEALDLVGIHRDGGLQERLRLPAGQVFPIGDIGAEAGAFVEPMSIAVHALHRAELRAGQHVTVLGAGPIGLAVVIAAAAAGARVMATDPVPSRRDLAAQVGAETVCWGTTDDQVNTARDWTRGKGPPVVVDTTGDPGALAQAVNMVCAAGRVVVVGMSAGVAPLRSGVFPEKEIDVTGSSCATAPDFREAIRLVHAHRDAVSGLFTHRFPLASAREAIECVASFPADIVKVLVMVQKG